MPLRLVNSGDTKLAILSSPLYSWYTSAVHVLIHEGEGWATNSRHYPIAAWKLTKLDCLVPLPQGWGTVIDWALGALCGCPPVHHVSRLFLFRFPAWPYLKLENIPSLEMSSFLSLLSACRLLGSKGHFMSQTVIVSFTSGKLWFWHRNTLRTVSFSLIWF